MLVKGMIRLSQANNPPATDTPPRHPREGGDPDAESDEIDSKFWGVSKEKVWIPIFLAFYVVLIWSFSAFTVNNDGNNRGTFGDMFGAVNALFSGLAFAGIIYTIILQSKELKLQRDEIRETRKEFKQQNETLSQQRFENTFFNMMSQHNEIISLFVLSNGIAKDGSPKYIQGRQVLSRIYQRLKVTIETRKKESPYSFPPVDFINDIYNSVYSDFSENLGVYFRSLYRIFKFIDESAINNKKVYSDILRSQLTDHEISLLFFNGMTQKGIKFKSLINEYALLNNIPNDEIFLDFRNSYEHTAY